MDRIHYAGDSILTGTDIARALLEYAQALAMADTAGTVDIPTVHEDGSVGRTELLVGPASQLSSSAEDSPFEELIDEELVARLRHQADELRRHGVASPAAVADSPDEHDEWNDYDVI